VHYDIFDLMLLIDALSAQNIYKAKWDGKVIESGVCVCVCVCVLGEISSELITWCGELLR